MNNKLTKALTLIIPGLLTAATGVGAGDIATAAFAGKELGLTILWGAILGAAMKFLLSEGLTRWQLVTGSTILAGSMKYFGHLFRWVFGAYLILWSFFVGAALISACGAAFHALWPIFPDPQTAKTVWGLAHSFLGVLLVRQGGFEAVEKVMAVCIALMFLTVVTTTLMTQPNWAEVAAGFIPSLPATDTGREWAISLIGGIGGSLTLLCYGYWIEELERTDTSYLNSCRFDLALGYSITALFGVCMIIIGHQAPVEGKGVLLIAQLASYLGTSLGEPARWLFLIGAWGAIFSSLLGVWQCVPHIFADFYYHCFGTQEAPKLLEQSKPYQYFLYAIATIPALSLFVDFKQIQKLYAMIGAYFIPGLALVLLILNNRKELMKSYRNNWVINLLLTGTLLFFLSDAAGIW